MKNVKELVKYWLKIAKHDHETMLSLFELRRYSDCLFYGHMVLEKALKALVAKNTKKHPKPIHNLLVLLQDSGVNLKKEETDFLAEANKFNIKARYPDYKLSFYKVCNFKYIKPRLEKIEAIYKKLCQTLKR